ncbi:DNA (cytosine-5)-methyltransferase CMT2 isoform X2 [Jatropha curcas]|uniref:DNA (cytosine-5)-methyltransferase CMT2 isoform X2 n=1 Tax=Jatropha curcas TaxID=180498 RepID=UPI0005FC1033|nr:DNA (cytosine-5)-methyltransferase CMT2 isoform X2 [Jatropha curcas]
MKSRSKSLTTSLVGIEGEPVPLQICIPEFPLRRSPRFFLSPKLHNVGSIILKSNPISEPEYCFRRSPRFSSCSPMEGDAPRGVSLVQSQSQSLTVEEEKIWKKKFSTETALRRTPGLSSAGTESSSSKPTLPKIRASTKLEAKPLHPWVGAGVINLRRSPRFTLQTKEDVDDDFLRQCSKKCSKNFLQPNGVHNIELNSDGCGLSNSFDEQQPFKRIKTFSENSDLGMSDNKFLRQSRRISSSAFRVQNGKTNASSVELPKSARKHSPKNKSDKQHSPEKIKPMSSKKKQKKHKSICSLIGDPVPHNEAQERWHWRYEIKSQKSNCRRCILDDDDEDKIVWNVKCHYTQAEIEGSIFSIGDCAYIKGEGGKKHVGRILEFFRTTDGEDFFRVQWFYRAEDTVIKGEAALQDKKRLFYSTLMNDNPIECIISKVSVVQIPPMIGSKFLSTPSDFYFDMEYTVDYSSFRTLLINDSFQRHDSSSPNVVEMIPTTMSNTSLKNFPSCEGYRAELALLDLFSGCGGMSTGLCLGAKLSCVDLVTRWALDCDKSACESLKLNHPETHVRNEAAEDFLELLNEWEKLCKKYAADDIEGIHQSSRVAKENENFLDDVDVSPGEYEVSRFVDICYGDPDGTGKRGLKFKVHWKGYSTSDDTWEPIEGLSNCQECIRNFVKHGFKSRILPLPGDVDVICGGPPCQGISGYNRYRNVNSPLADERNRQIVVFMDIVQLLKPKFVLMENVVDILKFDKASFARYALSRLVHMKYQARLGTVAAGCYGLPQFRLRVFLWGAHHSEKLPQFPLPTHDVIVRYWPPLEFERNTVAYNEDQPRELEKASILENAISDLPPVTSHETHEELTYGMPPKTDFQRFIRSTKYEMTGSSLKGSTETKNLLYDHRPYSLTEEDYARVCQIPKRKGANFRNLPGVVVGPDNVARRDPKHEQVLLPSGKPLVPDFALGFESGKSKRPYARLWWDETVSTVVTFPDLHSQAIIHPEQDRVLTIRECARLQGFPDYYRFCGTVKERYRQVGNAVAVPVGRALGYALGMAFQKLIDDEPLMKLPPKFSHSTNLQLANSVFQKSE